MTLVIDHVIYAVQDLDEASEHFLRQHGLASIKGGRHPGHGTANRIVPLGPDYIELIAVVDSAEAERSPLGSRIGAANQAGGGWIGYALRTDDLDAHIEPDSEIVEMSRRRPDGTELSWRIGRMADFLGDDRNPFLIQWDVDSDALPGRAPAPHRAAVTGIAWLEVGGDPPPVPMLDIRRVEGPAGLRRVGIGTMHGEFTI